MPSSQVLLLLAVVAVTLVWAVGRFLRVSRRGGREPLEDQRTKQWKADDELRSLLNSNSEIRALYQKIRFSPEVERECDRLLHELKTSIQVEIPDFAIFRDTLGRVERQLETDREKDPSIRLLTADAEASRNERLLSAVLAALDDHETVLKILNRDPLEELLPFVEQIPLNRNGKIIWCTPMELSVIRKRPKDSAQFARLLDDVDRLVRTARLRRKEQARKEVFEVISRVRRDLRRENAYILTSLKLLEAKVAAWLYQSSYASDNSKREHLDSLMRGLLEVRHAYRSRGGWRGSEEYENGNFKEAAQRQAKEYVDSPWMHTPWLTTLVLRNLLDSELVSYKRRHLGRSRRSEAVLRLVREEVASGHYDSDETIRRLRQMEQDGFYIHSLNYALLRMNRQAVAAR